MKKLLVLISLLMVSAAIGQTNVPQPKVTLRQGNVQQTVFAGETIEDIVYVVEGAHAVEFSLLESLTGRVYYDDFVEDSLITISGTIAENTEPGEYLIQILATDTIHHTSVNSMFYIMVIDKAEAFEHSSGSLEQTLTAGESIEPIVFDYQRLHHFDVGELPPGITATDDGKSKITIEGVAEGSRRDEKYTFALVAYLTETISVTYNIELNVEHLPVVTSIKILENDSQVVVAGDDIKPISLQYANITDLNFKDIPRTVDPYDDTETKTILLKGSIPEDLGDTTLVMKISAKGLDNNDSAFVTIIIKHKPGVTSIEHVSGDTVQTVHAGESIKPVVFKYAFAKSTQGVGFPTGTVKGEIDSKAKTITIKGTVGEDAFGEYKMKIVAEGYENSASADMRIIVIKPEPVSSSSAIVESSSSVLNSSSSVISSSSSVPVSSSSAPKSSSSANSSSSSEKSSSSAKSSGSSDKSSSSSDKSSSSVKKDKDALPTVAVAPRFDVEVVGRDIRVLGAAEVSESRMETYALLDLQGRVLRSGLVRGASFAIPVDRAGTYLVRIGNGVRSVSVK
jgi:hypothetical protein